MNLALAVQRRNVFSILKSSRERFYRECVGVQLWDEFEQRISVLSELGVPVWATMVVKPECVRSFVKDLSTRGSSSITRILFDIYRTPVI